MSRLEHYLVWRAGPGGYVAVRLPNYPASTGAVAPPVWIPRAAVIWIGSPLPPPADPGDVIAVLRASASEERRENVNAYMARIPD